VSLLGPLAQIAFERDTVQRVRVATAGIITRSRGNCVGPFVANDATPNQTFSSTERDSMIATTKPAVGYTRMSTDRQENSPDRQRREIKALADREGYRITKWYEDHGLTGTESANRP
jgi:hypothetical protein